MTTDVSSNNSLSVVRKLSELYSDKKKEYGSEYSSHWKERVADIEIANLNGAISISGRGFGEFTGIEKARSLYYRLKSIPTKLFILRMLRNCDSNHIKKSKEIISQMGKAYTYDDARMVLTINTVSKFIDNFDGATVAIIGDGYGGLGCLLKSIFPHVRIIQINLGEVLTFDAHYTGKVYPEFEHKLITKDSLELCKDFNYLEASKIRELDIQADVFFNIVSMGEMTLDTVENYFKILRQQRSNVYFYCCNRLSKRHPDGYVINFADYGWLKSDHVLLDELCPWHQRAPRNRPPFYYRFDGPIQHKLISIDTTIDKTE